MSDSDLKLDQELENSLNSKENDNTCSNCMCDESRRDFLKLSAISVATIGAGAALWPFVNSMNPSKDVLANSSIEVDISKIKEGESLTVMWRGKPVFIKRRTQAEIDQARKTDLKTLKDPQTDQERFSKNPQFLVVIGICTHLGCIPTQRKGINISEDGWLCACHGSSYDVSGRIIKGPAPKNLEVPEYAFINENTIKIG